MNGHAIESRICAEDVRSNFLPSTGTLAEYQPPHGPWVRVDSGVDRGGEISVYYDPMFAKLIVWGETRKDAIGRMKRALSEFRIAGVETTIPFCLYVMDHPKFIEGDIDIQFVGKHYDPADLPKPSEEQKIAAAVTAILFEDEQRVTFSAVRNGSSSKWASKRSTR